MLLTILVLMYGFRGNGCHGANGLILLPGTSDLNTKTKSVSILGLNSYMPKEKDFRTKKLLRLLGNSYDEEWMSIDDPEISNTVPEVNTHSDIIAQKANIELIRDEIARTLPAYLENNNTVRTITTFLTRMSICKIVFEWEDQGALFWPRYVKTGTCVSSGSCSWPPGMTCSPDGQKKLHILRWRCKNKTGRSLKKNKLLNCSENMKRNSSSKGGKIKCKWRKVPFDVTNKCVCSC